MFATLLMEEARTQARRNTGVVGSMALVAMPAVVSIQIGIAVLASAAGGADPGRDPGLVGGAGHRAAHLPALNAADRARCRDA